MALGPVLVAMLPNKLDGEDYLSNLAVGLFFLFLGLHALMALQVFRFSYRRGRFSSDKNRSLFVGALSRTISVSLTHSAAPLLVTLGAIAYYLDAANWITRRIIFYSAACFSIGLCIVV